MCLLWTSTKVARLTTVSPKFSRYKFILYKWKNKLKKFNQKESTYKKYIVTTGEGAAEEIFIRWFLQTQHPFVHISVFPSVSPGTSEVCLGGSRGVYHHRTLVLVVLELMCFLVASICPLFRLHCHIVMADIVQILWLDGTKKKIVVIKVKRKHIIYIGNTFN